MSNSEVVPAPSVAVCACTLHRPEGLARLLESLARLELDDGRVVSVRVVIVDNDPDASARPTVEAARAALPWELTYAVEPKRGIPFARNAAVAAAGDVDYVAFIDDDEWPDKGWLDELLRVAKDTGADVVTGMVEPVFDVAPPAWVVEGRFFDRPRFRTGERIHYARTSNVLIASHLFRNGPPFRDIGAKGGDDTHFFHRARLGGATIVWADDAVVREAVPETRVHVRWLVQRQYRNGLTRSFALRDLEGSPLRYAMRAAAGLTEVAKGLVLAPLALVRGRAAAVRAAATVARGAGLVVGLFGVGFDEYRTIHGR